MLDVLYYPVSAVMWLWHTLFALLLGPSSGVAWALSWSSWCSPCGR